MRCECCPHVYTPCFSPTAAPVTCLALCCRLRGQLIVRASPPCSTAIENATAGPCHLLALGDVVCWLVGWSRLDHSMLNLETGFLWPIC